MKTNRYQFIFLNELKTIVSSKLDFNYINHIFNFHYKQFDAIISV